MVVSKITITPLNQARVEGDACQSTDSSAGQCGEAMGKLLGEALQRENVVQVGEGN
jgi:hypothetical protein